MRRRCSRRHERRVRNLRLILAQGSKSVTGQRAVGIINRELQAEIWLATLYSHRSVHLSACYCSARNQGLPRQPPVHPAHQEN